MTLNPVIALAALYAFANLIALMRGITSGGFEIKGTFQTFSPETLLIAFSTQILLTVFLLKIYIFFSRRATNKNSPLILSKRSGLALLLFQLSYLIFVLQTGLNIVNSEGESSKSLFFAINYLFIFLSPDFAYYTISPLLKSKKYFVINSAAFLISKMLRGWLGGFMVVFLLALCRAYPLKLNARHLTQLALWTAILLAALPFVVAVKWSIRHGDPLTMAELFTAANNSLSLESYYSTFLLSLIHI